MDSAISILDNKEYTADQFQLMSEFEREKFKGHMKCGKCNESAYFRKKRRDGRKPCFCAKHKDGCDNERKSNENDKAEDLIPEFIINRRDDQFKIRKFNYLGNLWTSTEVDEESTEDFLKKGEQKRTHVLGGKERVITKKSLPQLLKLSLKGLINEQNYEIELSENKYEHIRNCVRELKHVNETMLGKEGYYWSYIVHATGNWLNTNTEYWSNPSYLVSNDVSDEFWNYIKLRPNQWNRPVPVIVKGELKKSNQGKLYVEINSLDQIYISTKDFKDAFFKYFKV